MKRKAWAWVGAAVTAVAATVAVVATASGARNATAATAAAPPNTATVTQGTLSATVSVPGTLTYGTRPGGSPYMVINQAAGIYTELPSPGQTLSQGQVLYRVNDSPVVLLYGSTPAYRTLSVGASGPDVSELNADLVARGYATRAQLSPKSASFGWATTTAVEKLQAALGMTCTGTLTLGQAVFEPTAVRVTSVSAVLGGGAQPGGTVLQGTSTIRQVQVSLDAAQQTSMAVGDKVSITLPNNDTTPGVVSSVGAVAICPPSSGAGGSGSAPGAPGADTCSSGSSASSAPTITVDVTPSHPAATGTWDQAPVQVGITTASVPDALVVPVTALLAQAGGGYAVEVVGARGRHYLAPVSLGMFDDAEGLVQVTGSGVVAGQQVVVPGT